MSLLRAVVRSTRSSRSFAFIAIAFAVMALASTSASAMPEGDPTGACCIGPNGACVQVTQADCQAMNGFYRGDGSDCSVCGVSGRCCVNDGGVVNCSEVPLWECANTPGWMLFTTPGNCTTDCGQIGACCYTDGCLDTLELICTLFYSGTFLGEGTSCDDCGEIPTTGMCCIELAGRGSYECIETTFDDCVFNQGGEFFGVGVICDDLYFCGDFSEAGACCLPSGGCVYTTIDICEFDLNGVFQGEGEWCVDVDCGGDPTPGACCYNDGTACDVVSLAECFSLGGSFAGPNTFCGPDTCIDMLGKCCLQDGKGNSYCLTIDINGCFGIPGSAFWSLPGLCEDPGEPPCPPLGACCLPSGGCALTTVETCQNFYNGTYKGNGTNCADLDANGTAEICERPGDVNDDGVVNVTDLLAVIGAWGNCPHPCPADVAPFPNGDGMVNVTDLLLVISNWG